MVKKDAVVEAGGVERGVGEAPGWAPLPRSFYEPSAALVARRLLGHWLIHQTPEGACGGVIVETEAYLFDDPACHAYRGETKRNRTMFGRPGCSYVYLIYGVHYCFNTVCRDPGFGEAVLIRAIDVSFGADWMRRRRGLRPEQEWTSGPGRMCAALGIDSGLDGVDLCDARSPLLVARNPGRETLVRRQGPVIRTTRIGISQGSDKELRFYLEGSRYVSRRVRRDAGNH